METHLCLDILTSHSPFSITYFVQDLLLKYDISNFFVFHKNCVFILVVMVYVTSLGLTGTDLESADLSRHPALSLLTKVFVHLTLQPSLVTEFRKVNPDD